MASTPFYGTIPGIAQAFQNDPRTKLAQSALALGTSTAPVAAGGWGVTDGLARAAQAIAGAVVNKGQEKKYAAREAAYMAGMANAAGMAGGPAPAGAPNPMAAAAGALGGPPASQIAPPQPQMAPSATSLPPAPGSAPVGPNLAAMAGAAPAMAGAAANLSASDLYRRGIRPIEGGTDPTTGAFRTSPKGAVGPGQIMPGTGPEAARLAGLPWDEKRFKSDAAYNDALGQAYYAKQLDDFGDPAVAAAAYNAGPGRVRRAIRQGARSGQGMTAHLPAETRTYLQKFQAQLAGAAPLPGQAGTGVEAPVLEDNVSLPPAPSVEAPAAPQLPQEVQSSRLAMARALMQSGNPDLAVIAQEYLDKGLTEQNDARRLASDQQFQQGQTGYNAALADYGSSRSQDRQAQYDERAAVKDRNFKRENRYADQRFQAGQNEVQRQYGTSERLGRQSFESAERRATQAFQDQQRISTQGWTSSENKLDRENRLEVAGIRKDAAGMRGANRNAYFNSPTGLKMQAEAGKQIDANNVAVGKLQRFMDLNDKQGSGGIALNTPGVAATYRYFNSSLTEMHSLANDSTLANLGGSLGVAISDGDRKFIQDANISESNPPQANYNIARAQIGGLRRKNDYLTEFANAQADASTDPSAPAKFAREWSAFSQAVPVVKYDSKGNALSADDKPVTFQQWRASRPKYDASGRKVK